MILCVDPPWEYDRKYDPDSSRIANLIHLWI